MEQTMDPSTPEELDSFTIFLHFGLMLFGVFAWVTGEWDGFFKNIKQLGFPVHKLLGMGVALFVSARLFHGFCGPDRARFATWVPYTPDRLRLVFEDIRTLITLKLPDRPPHQGLAGLWEALGLMVFTWMSATGAVIFLFLTIGYKTHGAIHLLEELHEVGEDLVPIFLAVHVSAVIVHALAGDHRWRKMFFLKG